MRLRNSSPMLSLAVAGLIAFGSQHAKADPVFVTGSSVSIVANSSPDSFTQSVTLTPGNQLVDGGAVNLNIGIVPTGSAGAEWITFTYTTTSGGPLSGPSDDWSVNEVGIDLAVPANFSAAYAEFDENGTALTPTSSIFGGYAPELNPVTGVGYGLGASGFVDPLPAGPVGSLGTYISPFDYLDSTGIDSALVNGYEQAWEFTPTTPPAAVPEPTSLALLGGGLFAFGLIRRRRGLARPA